MPPTDKPFDQLIELMSVPDHPGVYVLGSFAKRVTLYSQQVRALNLVEALCKTGRLSPGDRVAVIGGGVAGLTAAAGAAARGLGVRLLEKFSVPLRLQRDSKRRYLHPHIYDWPDAGSLDDRAGLPLLDWKADFADKVAGEILEGWDAVKRREGVDVKEHFNLNGAVTVIPSPGGSVSLVWNDSGGPYAMDFAAVVVAVGFGLETDAEWKRSYWKDDSLDFREHKSWLVSGYGDGGLTDLIRLCIDDFHHNEIVTLFGKDADLERERRLLVEIEHAAEVKGRRSGDEARKHITEEYQRLESAPLMEALRGRLRKDTTVTFNGPSSHMYGPESSILNRFVVSQLARLKAFTHIPGKVSQPVRGDDNKLRVEFQHGQRGTFDEVIFRHGPAPALLEDFPALWEACETKRAEWSKVLPALDPTRKPMWADDAFRTGEAEPFVAAGRRGSARALVPAAGDELTCLVVLAEAEPRGADLLRFVRHALQRQVNAVKNQINRSLRVEPFSLDAASALADPDRYEQAVGDLCRADIVVFDVTGYEVGVMMLLGVRSVARRGVTITTIAEPLDAKQWAKLPFNLKELNPISYNSQDLEHNDPKHPIKMIGSMILKGLTLSRSLPQVYLDLPAFDAVRRLGSGPEDYRAITEREQVLVLCSFNQTYVKDNWHGFLSLELETAFDEEGQSPSLMRIIDIDSPRLVSHRLYAKIRRSSMCLVDWTGWRENVFYELGVRLAVNGIGPVNVISRDSIPARGTEPDREALLRLFSPLVYDLQGSRNFGVEIRDRYLKFRDTPGAVPGAGGGLAHDKTFELVYSQVPLEQEPGGVSVHLELLDSVNAMLGDDSRMQGSRPVLFSQNADLMKQVNREAVERLFAAWYYLRERHAPQSLPADDPLRQDYVTIGNRLASMLLESKDERDKKLGAEIHGALRDLKRQRGRGV